MLLNDEQTIILLCLPLFLSLILFFSALSLKRC